MVDARNEQLASDPATGILGELGFGTQLLPFSGKDIQDEKYLVLAMSPQDAAIISGKLDARIVQF